MLHRSDDTTTLPSITKHIDITCYSGEKQVYCDEIGPYTKATNKKFEDCRHIKTKPARPKKPNDEVVVALWVT